jgi:malonate decarboxylase beta subunit
MSEHSLEPSFQELNARARLKALVDDGHCIELLGPFDRLGSPWLAQQGLVAQSDDGVVVTLCRVDGELVVAIAIEAAFEGGSIGEVGGAKIAMALKLAAESCRDGKRIAALLLLETGGVRLQEANLGLAAIAAIQAAIIELRELAPVVALIAGPTGCFGGMSLAAALCTSIIGTLHGRVGMNGPEVIEQEAGPDEMDASDRELVWSLIGCEARLRAGLVDAMVEDHATAIAAAIRAALREGVKIPQRVSAPEQRLMELNAELALRDSAELVLAGGAA